MRLRIPPGTQTGQRFRFSERGAPVDARRPPRRSRVEVRLVLPVRLDSALEGTAARIRPNQRRRRAQGSDAPMKKTGKAYFMISVVAQKYNIHPQTLRLYEREGLLKPSRTEGNTRLYSEEDSSSSRQSSR
ncbi:MAG: MerR family DNA-binding transcriptional regulator [Vicinamibacterales bacterium]